MSVNVEIPSVFGRYSSNQLNFKVKGKTVGECLQEIGRQYPELKKLLLDKDGNLMHSYDVFINGESAYPQIMTSPVKDGDKLNLVMLIYGG